MKKCKICFFPQAFIKDLGKILIGIDIDSKPIYKYIFWNLGGIRRVSMVSDFDYFIVYEWYYYHKGIKNLRAYMAERNISREYCFKLAHKLISLPFPEGNEIDKFAKH